MRSTESQKKNNWEEKRCKTEQFNKLCEEINKQNILKRELDDNIKVKEKEQEIVKIEKLIDNYKKEINQYGNYQDFQKDRSELQENLDKYRKKKAETAGRLQGFENEVRRCNRDLGKCLLSGLIESLLLFVFCFFVCFKSK